MPERPQDRRLCPRCSGALRYDGRGYRCVSCAYRIDSKPDPADRPRRRKSSEKGN